MKWTVALLSACVLAGCYDEYAPGYGEPAGVIGARTMHQDQQFQRFAADNTRWGGSIQGQSTGQYQPQGYPQQQQGYPQQAPVANYPMRNAAPGGVIGAQSSFDTNGSIVGQSTPSGVTFGAPPAPTYGAPPVNAYNATPPSAQNDYALSQEMQVLSARIERLERLMAPQAAAPVAPMPTPVTQPTLSIYQVSPDGRIAWISSGTSSGIRQGQTFQIVRGSNAIGQAQVTRVWPGVSELSVLWSNGALQRGDGAVAVNVPTAPM
jgi:hypothetical protein